MSSFSIDDDELATATVEETPSPSRQQDIYYTENSLLRNSSDTNWKAEYERLNQDY
jgi:hypothetical protein